MAIGRISGPLLKSNLLRNGVDLAFETDLLYLDVNNGRIGIKTASPSNDLQIVGTTRTTDLIVDNTAEIGNISINGNTVESSSNITLTTAPGDSIVFEGRTEVNDISFDNNIISAVSGTGDLRLSTNGSGSVRLVTDTIAQQNLTVNNNFQVDGDIVLGQTQSNTVTFNSSVDSDIVPSSDNQYSLGSESNRWNNIWVNTITATNIETGDLTVDGVDLALRQGNIFFVAVNGDDTKSGTHLNDPFKTIGRALQAATAGDTIQIFPGVYQEQFPLTIPSGVTVKGHSLRSVFVQPTAETNNKDAFLLNGETTVEALTIGNYYYDSDNDTGYAFRYAPNFTVTSRSPYIRNITVLTEGSVKTTDDPRGFLQGDAGRGAYLDGSVATTQSKEASGLFHSVTFITPGVDAIILTNGVRVEWLNCFTYFANRSIYAVDGISGIKGQGKTALRVTDVTGSFVSGETIEYYDFDGTTLLASGTVDSVAPDGKIFIDGKVLGFELPQNRTGKQVQAFGNVQLSTTTKKFGTSSLEVDGVNGSYAFVSSSNDFAFGTDNFTVEMWVYRDSLSSFDSLIDMRTTSTDNALVIGLNGITPYVFVNGSFRIQSGTASLGVWNHIAYVRAGTTGVLYLNGQSLGSWTDNTNYISKPLFIGADLLGNNALLGFIDDLRIVKGQAIYTANFAPPISQLPSTQDTVLLLRFDGIDGSTEFVDNAIYDQDIRFSGGATAKKFNLIDYTDFGAEVRLIASASVYGNSGLVGDGAGVIMYAIGHNVAYIGSGRSSDNDPSNVVQAEEIVEANNAKIYYSTVDHKGDYRVGELFYVNQQDGSVQFTGADFNIDATEGITLTDGVNTTFINGDRIETGNWKISGNTVETLSGPANFIAASDQINLNNNVNVAGDLSVAGNVTISGNIQIGDETTDTIEIVARVGSDLIPATTNLYSIGSSDLRWNTVWASEVRVDSIKVDNNTIESVASNADLTLKANGTGSVVIPSNDVIVDQNLTVQGETTLSGLVTIGSVLSPTNIVHTGDVTQTGNFNITGNLSTDTLDVSSVAQFENIRINSNIVTTTVTGSNLVLRANTSTDVISIPDNDVVISQDLTVNGTIGASSIDVTTSITADQFTTGNILISNNVVETTQLNSDLILKAAGSGIVSIPNNDVVISQDLTVNGTSTFNLVNIGSALLPSTITHVGNTTQTGDFIVTGNVEVTGTLDVSSTAQFENIRIDSNTITTTVENSDLIIDANGTGQVIVPTSNVVIEQDLTVNSTSNLSNVESTGTITADEFFTGDIRIRQNIVETTLPNSNLELIANGTGSVHLEDLAISNNSISPVLNTDLVLKTLAGNSIKFNSTESITIPKGTTLERPTSPESGMLRFNTTTAEYEGYNGTSWVRLRGVYDEDEDTFITAELTPGSNDNVIRFYAGGSLVADINDTRFNTAVIDVGDIRISNNVIETTTVDQDLTIRATGENSAVIVENFAFNQNTITNIVPNSVTEFYQDGLGYFKIDSSSGFVVPLGTSGQRPANPVLGLTRYNTELQLVEIYNGSQWISVAGSEGGITATVAQDIAIETVLYLG